MPVGPYRQALSLVGSASCDEALYQLAYETGGLIAQSGAILVCGGGGGVMAAGCAGAKSAGGTTVGILPGSGPADSPPNPHVDVAIFTGLGQARNQIVVLSGACVIAVGGEWGTLSEIALASKYGVPVVLLASWSLEAPSPEATPSLRKASSPTDAVALALQAARSVGRR